MNFEAKDLEESDNKRIWKLMRPQSRYMTSLLSFCNPGKIGLAATLLAYPLSNKILRLIRFS